MLYWGQLRYYYNHEDFHYIQIRIFSPCLWLQSLDEEDVVHIKLTTKSTIVTNSVRYNYHRCAYAPVTSRQDHDHLLHLLTLPSIVVHKDDPNSYSLACLALKYMSSTSLRANGWFLFVSLCVSLKEGKLESKFSCHLLKTSYPFNAWVSKIHLIKFQM